MDYTLTLICIYYNECFLLQSKQEALLLEISVLINEIKNTLFHLKEWVKPEKVRNET